MLDGCLKPSNEVGAPGLRPPGVCGGPSPPGVCGVGGSGALRRSSLGGAPRLA